MKYTIPVTDMQGTEWFVTKEYADMFRQQEIDKGDSIDIITDTGKTLSLVVDEGTCSECVCHTYDTPCIVLAADPQQEDDLEYAESICVFRENKSIFKDRHKILEEL